MELHFLEICTPGDCCETTVRAPAVLPIGGALLLTQRVELSVSLSFRQPVVLPLGPVTLFPSLVPADYTLHWTHGCHLWQHSQLLVEQRQTLPMATASVRLMPSLNHGKGVWKDPCLLGMEAVSRVPMKS